MPDDNIIITITLAEDVTPGLDAIEASLAGVDASLSATAGSMGGFDAAFAASQASIDAWASSMNAAGIEFFTFDAAAGGFVSNMDAATVSLDALSTSADASVGSLGADYAAMQAASAAAGDLAASITASNTALLDAAAADDAATIGMTGVSLEAAAASLGLDAEAVSADAAAVSTKRVGAAAVSSRGGVLSFFRTLEDIRRALELVTLIAGIAAAAIGVKLAGDFQQGVNRLVTGAGDVTDNMTKMGQAILGVSADTGVMSGDLLKAMYLILSSGQRGAQALDTLSVAAKGAVIEQAKVVDVANVLSGVMTNYGTHVYSATDYMNGLIKAVQQGKITLQDLATAMGPIDPIAHNLGISFNDVAAAMTTQTNAMIPAARAATGLRFMMLALENPTKKATTAMQAMGLSSVAVANEMKVSLPGALEMIYNAAKKAGPEGSVPFDRALSDMVGGIRSLSTFTALTGSHLKDFAANSLIVAAAMKQGHGAVSGWALAQSGFNVQMGRAIASLAALGTIIGTYLLPIMGQLAGSLASTFQSAQSTIMQFFDAVQQQATQQTDLMKLHVLANTAATAQGAISHLQALKQGVMAAILETHNAVARHTLEMQLTAINHAMATQQGVVTHMQAMEKQVNAALALLPSVANVHTLQMKAVATANTLTMQQQILANLIRTKQGIEQQMAEAKTAAEKHALAMRLAVVNHAIGMQQGTVKSATTMHTQVVSEVQKMQATLAAQKANPIQQLVDAFNRVKQAAIDFWNSLQPALKFLHDGFMPILIVVGNVMQNTLVPAWKQFTAAIQPALPALRLIGMVLGGIILGAIIAVGVALGLIITVVGLVIAALVRLGTSFMNFLADVTFVVTHIVGWFKWLGQQIIANVTLVGSTLISLLKGIWNTVVSQVMWFVNKVVGFFTWLWHMLVGGSIIPDMINGIFSWFNTLISQGLTLITTFVTNIVNAIINMKNQVITWVQGLVTSVTTFFTNLAASAVQWGLSLINNFLSGLQSAWQNVISWIQGALSFIAGLFPHSPAKYGPLVGLESWGENIGKQLVGGMNKGLASVRAASTQLALAISQPIQQTFSASSTNQMTNNLLQQIRDILREQNYQQSLGNPPTSATSGTVVQHIGPVSIHGGAISNTARINEALGRLFEAGDRGGFLGSGA